MIQNKYLFAFLVLLLTYHSSRAQIITTIAGLSTLANCANSGDGGSALLAEVSSPRGICADVAGNLFFSTDSTIRRIDGSTGIITTIAGLGTTYADGVPATDALMSPFGICLDTAYHLLIADAATHSIRSINMATGIITTVAGNGTMGYSGDGGQATAAKLNNPYDVKTDHMQHLYIADRANNIVRFVNT